MTDAKECGSPDHELDTTDYRKSSLVSGREDKAEQQKKLTTFHEDQAAKDARGETCDSESSESERGLGGSETDGIDLREEKKGQLEAQK